MMSTAAAAAAAGGDDDDAKYECRLDAETEKKAMKELNEDPKDRLNAVQALRTWIRQQPHLTSKTDTLTLLYMLRTAKFSQLRAREIVENNAKMYATFPQWMRDVDTHDPSLVEVIESGYIIPLPKKDSDRCPILLFRLGATMKNGHVISLDDQAKATMVALWLAAQDENVHVNGFVFICDLTGFGTKHMTGWKMDDLRKWKTSWQRAMPGRYKAFHYYNAGAIFETLMAMSKPFLTKKMHERIHLHDTMESLYKSVDMQLLPIEYLPDEYRGPSAGPTTSIIDKFKRDVMSPEFRELILDQSSERSYGLDESKRPNYKPVNESFRKLAID